MTNEELKQQLAATRAHNNEMRSILLQARHAMESNKWNRCRDRDSMEFKACSAINSALDDWAGSYELTAALKREGKLVDMLREIVLNSDGNCNCCGYHYGHFPYCRLHSLIKGYL